MILKKLNINGFIHFSLNILIILYINQKAYLFARSLSMNKQKVNEYFKLLKDIFEQNGLLTKSGIYNVDETGLQLTINLTSSENIKKLKLKNPKKH